MMVGGNIAHETRVLTTSIVLETGRGEMERPGPRLVLLTLAFIVNGVLTWYSSGRDGDAGPRSPLLEVRDLVTRANRQILAATSPISRRRWRSCRRRQEHAAPGARRPAAPGPGSIVLDGVPVVPDGRLAYRRRIGLVFPAPLLLHLGHERRRGPAVPRRRRAPRRRPAAGRALAGAVGDRPPAGPSGQPASPAARRSGRALPAPWSWTRSCSWMEPFVALDSTRAQLLDDFERLRVEVSATRVLVTHHLHQQAAGWVTALPSLSTGASAERESRRRRWRPRPTRTWPRSCTGPVGWDVEGCARRLDATRATGHPGRDGTPGTRDGTPGTRRRHGARRGM